MPPAVAAVATAVTAASIKAALVKFVVSTAISLALNAASDALFGKKPKSIGGSATSFERGIQDIIRGGIEPHRIIYGQTRVGAVMNHATTVGQNNKYIYLVLILAAHEVEEIGDVWFDDELLPALDVDGWVRTGTFKDKVRIIKHLGSPDQVADAMLLDEVDEWEETDRIRGRAYVAIKMEYDSKAFPTNLPNPRFLVKGKKVYDPRVDETVWTNNWALCVHDYIKSEYGVGALDDEFDESNIIAQANLCDEDVPISGTETQKRYTLDGAILADENPAETLDAMKTAAAAEVTWTSGVYRLQAGSYQVPTVDLNADDFIGAFSIVTNMPRSEVFNRVRGTFVNPDNFWQPSDIPVIENATYEAIDGGEQITKDVEHEFITDSYRAQRINKIFLERSRLGMTVSAKANLKALKLAVGKTVSLNIPAAGFDNKVFMVERWVEVQDGVELFLREEVSSVYDWNFGQATIKDPAPNSSLPDPRSVAAPTGLSFRTESYIEGGSRIARLVLNWVEPDDGFVVGGGHLELQFKRSSDTEWEPSWAVRGDITQATTPPLELGVAYDLRVRSVNRMRVESEWQYLLSATVGGSGGGVTAFFDFGQILETATTNLDYGLITDAVSVNEDYGSII